MLVNITWYDVTIPMEPGMTVWPGDPEFEFTPVARVADGAGANVSRLSMSTHIGTHVDAPWHFEENGKRLHEVDSAIFFGKALVLDIPNVDLVTADHLGDTPLPPRVLIKTRNSIWPVNESFRKDFVALAPDAADRLVSDGVKLIGVDYYSVAPFKQPGQPTHHILLKNDVLVIEGLRLAEFDSGMYWFTVLPLALVGADGAPCRAFIGKESPT